MGVGLGNGLFCPFSLFLSHFILRSSLVLCQVGLNWAWSCYFLLLFALNGNTFVGDS